MIQKFKTCVRGDDLRLDLHFSMDKDVDDPDLCEYVVRVDWIKTLPKHEAIWEKRMFANQNSARHFQLDEG